MKNYNSALIDLIVYLNMKKYILEKPRISGLALFGFPSLSSW